MFQADSSTLPAHVQANDTLVSILQRHAIQKGEELAFGFLESGEILRTQLSFAELDRGARAVAARLQAMDQQNGHVMLLFPSSLDYIVAFFGCLYAGVTAVPVYPPAMGKQVDRVEKINRDCAPFAYLTNRRVMGKLQEHMPGLAKADNCLVLEEIDDALADTYKEQSVKQEDIAFLQYTSGSTGDPKGVMVSHGNLIHNATLIHSVNEYKLDQVIISWLPLFHDMGLIGKVLYGVFAGCPAYVMSPLSFIQKPIRWLQAISTYRGTYCGAPNFAYEMILQKATDEEIAELDLSCLRNMFNGAEPVRHDTIQRFMDRFAVAGLKREVMLPVYGMAETTLIVTGGYIQESWKTIWADSVAFGEEKRLVETHAGAPGSQPLVGCGHIRPGTELLIVDPQSLEICPEGYIGEIWVKNGSICIGYWNRPDQSERTFQAYTSDTQQGPFLRTGDLGLLKDGELYFASREKDLIIIRGRNHYPQDIELTVEQAHPSCRVAGGAAFSVDGHQGENLVVVQEIERGSLKKFGEEEIFAAIRKAIGEVHELQAHAIMLIKRGSVQKTSSGKIMRRAMRLAYLHENLKIEAAWKMPEEAHTQQSSEPLTWTEESLQQWIMEWVARKAGMKLADIDARDSIAAYGIDSMAIAEFEGEISKILGFEWPVMDFLVQEPAISEVAEEGIRLLHES